MDRFVMSLILVCVLSVGTLGGQIPSVPGPQPPPSGSSAPGDIPSGGVAEQFSGDALTALLSAVNFLTV